MSFFSPQQGEQPKYEDIEEELEALNEKYKCLLNIAEGEVILHRPILAEKIKPKNVFGVFQK